MKFEYLKAKLMPRLIAPTIALALLPLSALMSS